VLLPAPAGPSIVIVLGIVMCCDVFMRAVFALRVKTEHNQC